MPVIATNTTTQNAANANASKVSFDTTNTATQASKAANKVSVQTNTSVQPTSTTSNNVQEASHNAVIPQKSTPSDISAPNQQAVDQIAEKGDLTLNRDTNQSVSLNANGQRVLTVCGVDNITQKNDQTTVYSYNNGQVHQFDKNLNMTSGPSDHTILQNDGKRAIYISDGKPYQAQAYPEGYTRLTKTVNGIVLQKIPTRTVNTFTQDGKRNCVFPGKGTSKNVLSYRVNNDESVTITLAGGEQETLQNNWLKPIPTIVSSSASVEDKANDGRNELLTQSPSINTIQGVLDQSQAKMVGTYPWFYNLDSQHVRFSENGIQQLKDGTFMLSGNAPDSSNLKNGRDQDLVMIHLDKNFNLIDSMRILHGGHGSSCGAIMNNNGQIMVYEMINDRSNPKGNNRVIMIPYQPHKTLKNNDSSIKVLVKLKDEVNFDGGAAISQDGKYLAYSTASDIYGTQNLQIHVCQIENGKLVPVTTIDKSKIEPGSQSILQAFTFQNDGELIVSFGGAANNPQNTAKMKVDPREIVGVDIKTGKVLSDDQLDFAHNKAYGVTQATSAEPEGITVTNDGKGVFIMVGTWQRGINYDDKTPRDMSGKIYFIPFKSVTTSIPSNNNNSDNNKPNNKPANRANHSINGTSKSNSGAGKPASGTNDKPAENNNHDSGVKGKNSSTNVSGMASATSGKEGTNINVNGSNSSTNNSNSSSDSSSDNQPLPDVTSAESHASDNHETDETGNGSQSPASQNNIASTSAQGSTTAPASQSKPANNSSNPSANTSANGENGSSAMAGGNSTTPGKTASDVNNGSSNKGGQSQAQSQNGSKTTVSNNGNVKTESSSNSGTADSIAALEKKTGLPAAEIKKMLAIAEANGGKAQFQNEQQYVYHVGSQGQAVAEPAGFAVSTPVEEIYAPAQSASAASTSVSSVGSSTAAPASTSATQSNPLASSTKTSNALPETGMANEGIEFAAVMLALTGIAMVKREYEK